MKRLFLLLCLIVPLTSFGAPQEYKFIWNFKKGELFTVDKYTDQTIIKNGQIVRQREIRDYVALVPILQNGSKYLLKGRYYSYQRPLHTDSAFQLNEVYNLNFYMDNRGFYTVPEEYIMPTIRDIPVFPDKMIEPGFMWQQKGLEIMEFKPPVPVPVEVNYQFVGMDDKKLSFPTAKIVFNYLLNHVTQIRYTDIPYKFVGSSYSTLWYDVKKELPHYIENVYDIGFIYPDGTVIQYKGELKGYYNKRQAVADKEKEKEKIIDNFKKEDKELDVKKSEEGVVVQFGDIYFEYNSHTLTEEAKEKLDNIGKVLQKYKDYPVIMKGHTDNIGSQSFNMKLSEQRAKSVLDYLLEKNYLDPKQGSYKGYGKENPIADNRTEEGRKKNRRVEIIIIPE
ncbi:MAG: OmpA family protein [Spirochaetes bacterium]|nr:OmpA family protein [Spirochaetota bacterium]